MSELIAHGRHYEVAMRAPGTRSPHTTASVSDPHRTRLRCLKHASQCASQAQPWCMLQWRLRPTGPGSEHTRSKACVAAWCAPGGDAAPDDAVRCGARPCVAVRCGARRSRVAVDHGAASGARGRSAHGGAGCGGAGCDGAGCGARCALGAARRGARPVTARPAVAQRAAARSTSARPTAVSNLEAARRSARDDDRVDLGGDARRRRRGSQRLSSPVDSRRAAVVRAGVAGHMGRARSPALVSCVPESAPKWALAVALLQRVASYGTSAQGLGAC